MARNRNSHKEDAAARAQKLYLDVRANGWDAVMSRRRGNSTEKKVNVTVGEYIEAVTAKSLIYPKTIQSYAKALRKIVVDMTGQKPREARCGQVAHARATEDRNVAQ